MRAGRTGQDRDQASERWCSNVETEVSLQDNPNRVSGNMEPFHVFPGHFGFHNSTLEDSVEVHCNLMNEVGGQSPVSHCGGLSFIPG
jgi:hypothetical protein